MHAAAAVEIVYCFLHFAAGKLFHGPLKRWVFLPHYLIEARGLHSCFL